MLYQRINVLGTFLPVKYGFEYLKKRKGAVVTISSVRGKVSDSEQEGYATSKGVFGC
jgi:NAD(P)-dependent dehydrogenase (short-subunit alcohol dehydrogenase family)